MIANLHQTATTTFEQVREKKVTTPSTYKQRVVADRVVMLIILIATIVFSVLGA